MPKDHPPAHLPELVEKNVMIFSAFGLRVMHDTGGGDDGLLSRASAYEMVHRIRFDQVCDQVSDQVARLLKILSEGVALKAGELMQRLGLAHRPTFRGNYLNPALAAGLIEMTDPASPRSPVQKYRLSAHGKHWVNQQ